MSSATPGGIHARRRVLGDVMPRSSRIAGLCTALLLLCIVGACSLDSAEEIPTVETPEAQSTIELTWPVYQGLDMVGFERARSRALDALLVQCMSRFGLDYPAPAYRADDSRDNRWDHHAYRRFGVDSMDEASNFGYINPSTVYFEEQKKQFDESVQFTPSHDLVMWGSEGKSTSDVDPNALGDDPESFNGVAIPEGGCIAQAYVELEGDDTPASMSMFSGDPDIIQGITLSASARFEEDDRVDEVNADWADCMSGKGYEYESWDDPLGTFTRENGAPTRKEIETATADVECKHEINLVGRLYAIEAGYQIKLIEERSIEIEEVRNWMDSAVRRYEDVAAG
ncbi:hypothetical protein AB0B28_06600 [Glycomyces sp. NPDC046736]|uniref:hypothetical protein n=1 Tax=Glycomyces sp. NPDC046736 TaxID=3155615 RepID=UPI0034070869